MPSVALDKKKWAEAKKLADAIYKTHSAYKSGYIVKKYKELGGKFAEERARSRSRSNTKSSPKNRAGLTRWFAEKWVNQHGEVGYEHKNDVYRPSRRITKDTPTTWKELTPEEIERAKKIKAKNQRIKKFKTK